MDELRSSSISSQGYGNVYKKVLKDQRLSKVAKLIHCYFCSYAGAGDTAFPSVKLLCHDLDLNESTYYENLLYLKAYGYITVEQKQDSKGKFRNNIYTIQHYPEQYEDKDCKEQIDEMMQKRKEKYEKAKKKKQPYTENPGTDENIPSMENPCTDNPSTDEPSTDNPGTNINNSINNSDNSILLSIPIEDLWSYTQNVLNSLIPNCTFWDAMKLFGYNGDYFTFTVADEFSKGIIELRYVDRVIIALQEALKAHKINDIDVRAHFIV